MITIMTDFSMTGKCDVKIDYITVPYMRFKLEILKFNIIFVVYLIIGRHDIHK